MNKGLRLDFVSNPMPPRTGNGIDDLMNKGLRQLVELAHADLFFENGIDDLMNKGLRLPHPLEPH